jgi:hypothetical protein
MVTRTVAGLKAKFWIVTDGLGEGVFPFEVGFAELALFFPQALNNSTPAKNNATRQIDFIFFINLFLWFLLS